MIRWIAPLPLFLLASCPPQPDGASVTAGVADLESAAIARGLVRDPARIDPTGLYARDTDRLCIVPDGGGYRVGAFVDYGDGIACNGAGTARRSGGVLRISLADGKCRFEARYDGDRIVFPARMPDGCAALCERRASLAALDVRRLGESVSEATAMRDSRGRLPCATH
ncbi:MAG TPA: hypothetical protein VNR91_06810 [Sphingomonas sp.]|nr:hypothetical protein [Sphingomonas sp.]